jgi:hypothetical protein
MKLNHFVYLMFALMTFGCRTAQVNVTEQQPNFRLQHYSSFDFLDEEEENMSPAYRENIQFIKDEIVRQMEARGISHDQENPELMVNIGVAVEDRVQTRETGLVTDPGTFNYIGQRRYKWQSETIETGRYQKGTATMHLVDVEEQQAVWVGVLEKVLPRRDDRLKQAIESGVEKMFAKMDDAV